MRLIPGLVASTAEGAPSPAAPSVAYQFAAPAQTPAGTWHRGPWKGMSQVGKVNGYPGNWTTHFNDDSLVQRAACDDCYIRTTWRNIQPGASNEFNFAELDSMILNRIALGMTVSIGIIGWNPVLEPDGVGLNYMQAYPDFLEDAMSSEQCFEPGDTGDHYIVNFIGASQCSDWTSTGTCSGLWAPNQDHAYYRQAMVNLEAAVRAHYDNFVWAERISYIDIRPWGSWGESHNTNCYIENSSGNFLERWPLPNFVSQKLWLDEALKFDHIVRLVNFDHGDDYQTGKFSPPTTMHPAVYFFQQLALSGKSGGWREDGSEVTDFEIGYLLANYPEFRDAWMLGPVHSEPMDGQGVTSSNAAECIAAWIDYGNSGFNPKWTENYPNNTTVKDAIDAWLRDYCGYRLYVSQATLPAYMSQGASADLSVTISNAHRPPMYHRHMYELQVKAVREGGGSPDQVFNLSGADLRDARQGNPISLQGACSFPAAGVWKLYVGVIQKVIYGDSRGISLANDGTTQDARGQWWTYLADAVVS